MVKVKYLILLIFNVLFVFAQKDNLPDLPKTSNNLILTAPIDSWDEAIPLGNGLMGGLLWGKNNTIHLSLDRGDLWDERTNGPRNWWKTQTWAKGGPMWEKAYHGASPTKLPAGAMEITLTDGITVKSFELNKATAEGIAHLSNGQQLRVFFSAVEPIAFLRVSGKALKATEVLSPLQVSAQFRGVSAGPDSHSIDALGYTAATNGEDKNAKWYVQKASEGLEYCVRAEIRSVNKETIIAIAVTTNQEGEESLTLARRRCTEALDGLATKKWTFS